MRSVEVNSPVSRWRDGEPCAGEQAWGVQSVAGRRLGSRLGSECTLLRAVGCAGEVLNRETLGSPNRLDLWMRGQVLMATQVLAGR